MSDDIVEVEVVADLPPVKQRAVVRTATYWIHWVLAALGGIYAFAVIWLTVGDVVGRYVFGKPIPAALEISEVMVVYATFLGLGLVQWRREHAAVPMLVERLPPRFQIGLNIFVLLVSAAFFAVFGWQSFKEAMHSTGVMESYISYPIPIYPAHWAVFAGFALLSLQLFLDVFTDAGKLIRMGAKRK
jgi:TRAP-type transport system small permease protein